MVKVANDFHLRRLGIEVHEIKQMLDRGIAFCAIDHRGLPAAAFGIVFLEHGKGEVWAAFSKFCRLKHLLSLVRLFKKIQSLFPDYFVLVALKAKDGVAFEKLALMCGFKLNGIVQLGHEYIETAIYGDL